MNATTAMSPTGPDAPDEVSPESTATFPMVIWVHDGPLCVTVVDLPAPHAPRGVCRCPACRAHDPEEVVRFL